MKVKGIELFKMIADGKVNQHTRVSVDNYNDCSLDFVFEDGRNIFKWLDEYFEILEDKKEEIEELDTLFCMSDFTDIKYCKGEIDFNFKEMQDKINELVRSYNSLIKKQDTSKETNCMTDYGGSMCKYCNSKEYTIRISVDRWIEQDKKFIPENNFEVEFCPMCR